MAVVTISETNRVYRTTVYGQKIRVPIVCHFFCGELQPAQGVRQNEHRVVFVRVGYCTIRMGSVPPPLSGRTSSGTMMDGEAISMMRLGR